MNAWLGTDAGARASGTWIIEITSSAGGSHASSMSYTQTGRTPEILEGGLVYNNQDSLNNLEGGLETK